MADFKKNNLQPHNGMMTKPGSKKGKECSCKECGCGGICTNCGCCKEADKKISAENTKNMKY